MYFSLTIYIQKGGFYNEILNIHQLLNDNFIEDFAKFLYIVL